MKTTFVQNAVGSLEKLLGNAKDALWQVTGEKYGDPGFGYEGGTYADPRRALAGYLQETYRALLVVLDGSNLTQVRADLLAAWKTFEESPRGGLRSTVDDDEDQYCESPALTYLDHIVGGLRMSVSAAITSEEAWTLARLEKMLRDTPVLVHRWKRCPARELELQMYMHDYLSASFADFTDRVEIGGTIKCFKPDCGVRSVGAAIEFKYIDSEQKAAVAFSGLAEDSAAYKGSKDWIRFYAVVYQTGPFMLESHLRSDMKRIGAVAWEPMVVNGFGPPRESREVDRNTGGQEGS